VSAGGRWTHTAYTQRLLFGVGAVERVGEVLRELGVRKALLVTTAARATSDDGARLVRVMGRALASTYDGVRSHVPTDAVMAATRQVQRDGVDGVVSFGGGSCMDLGKAVCFFTEQNAGAPASSYADRPLLPHVTVPTTYSGAELTPFFGMTDERTRAKRGAGGPTTAPVAAVYDPVLTSSTPVRVSAETALNALAHCVEATYARRRSPEAEAVAVAGAERIVRWLPMVVDDPGDLDARTGLLEGAALAGRSLQNATMGVHHGLSQILGGRTGIPHGLANAVILPHAMRFNGAVAEQELARLAPVLGDGADVADAVARLVARVGLPTRLRDTGISEDDLDAVARLSQSSPAVADNPRPVSEADARAILAAAW
jgi:maleylacetate reductase